MRNVPARDVVLGLSLLIASGQCLGEASRQQIEEIVVTGSYIKRTDSFNVASPINVVDQLDIATQGYTRLGEVIRNQTFNYGSDFINNSTASTYQEGNQTRANLRGLGEAATLALADGRRTADANVNLTYPQIAVARIETLTDGASALYGSDAVAGVVNLIPRKDFNGLDLEIFRQGDVSNDYAEDMAGLIAGTDVSERTHIVAAMEFRSRDRLMIRDRPDYARKSFSRSGTGQPGTWLVPVRAIDTADADGDGDVTEVIQTGVTRTPDPGCGIDNGIGGTDKAAQGNYRSGRLSGTTCQLEFGEWFDYLTDYQGWSGWVYTTYEFNDAVTFSIEASWAHSASDSRGSPSNPGGRIAELGAVAGDHPGNPYRAYVDSNGNGAIDNGERLFAQDANGNGVPDRDLDGDGLADLGAEGNTAAKVLLAADPFDPTLGIAFNEDVVPAALRIIGKQGLLPTGHRADGSGDGSAGQDVTLFRWVTGFDVLVPSTSWTASLFYTWDRTEYVVEENQAESFSAVLDGINGRLGSDNDQYFNPFSTREHPCVDRICDPTSYTDPSSPAYNTQFVVDEVSFKDENLFPRWELQDLNLVATGDVFELPAGNMGLAVGAEWRKFSRLDDLNPYANSCDRWVNACGFDFEADRTTNAIFGELAIPVLNASSLGTLDVQLAVRREDSGGELKSTDPKIAIRWQPIEWLAVRGSYSTSFIAPSLGQQFAPSSSFLENMIDPTCEISGECVDSGSFRTQTFGSSASLSPEQADVWNIGFSVSFLDDDLRFAIDAMEFDFKDRISRLRGQDILDQDAVRFSDFVAGGGTRTQWIDPSNKTSGQYEDPRILRSVSGEIVEVLTSYVNAQTMLWRGLDFNASYRWDADEMPFIGGSYGSFELSLEGTYVDTYEYRLTANPNERCPGSTLAPPCEAAGNRNDRTSVVPPVPRLRTTGRLRWDYGNNAATLYSRYVGKVHEDSALSAFNRPDIDSLLTFDVQYSYHFEGLIGEGSGTTLTVGLINVFDDLIDPMVTLGGLETFLHDPRGRVYYLKIDQSF